MERAFIIVAAFISLLVARAADTESDLERADGMVDRDPSRAVALCDSISGSPLSDGQKGILHHIRGNAYFALGRIEDAAMDFDRSIESATAARDSATLASALSDRGICYRLSQKPDSALMYYNEALSILEKIDAPVEEAYLLTSVAVLYANLGRTDEAAKFGRRAFAIAKRTDEPEPVMYAGQTLGIVLYQGGLKDEGLAVGREIVNIAQRHGLPRYILKTYASIVDMHYKDGQRDSVDYYISKGNEILNEIAEASVEALGFLEENYVVLAAYGKYRESLDIQKKILGMKGAGTFMPFDKLYLRMARNYGKLGDAEQMADCYERSIALSDSLHGIEIDRQLSEFDIRYDTAQRELKIVRLEAERSRQRMWTVIVMIAAISVIAGGILFFISRSRRMKRQMELSSMRDQLDAIDSERARFAAELHDGICSDLTGIALLMQTPSADNKEIAELIGDVRDDVRSISHNLMPPRLEDLSLLQLVRNLALRYDRQVSVSQIAPFSDSKETDFQIYRIIQECLENISRHSDADSITIVINDRSLDICDNGSPLSENVSSGIGTQTIAKRAESIGANIKIDRNNEKNRINITLS